MRAWPLLLVTATLAGCAGGDGVSGAPEELVEVGPGLWVLPGHGVLQGMVRNDAGLPVKDARVSVIGTDFFSDTGRGGGFRFVNITAGPHTVQASAQGFQTALQETNVTAGTITDVDVGLVPEQSVGAGYRPHAHNLWGPAGTYVLFDGSFALHEADEGGTPLVPAPVWQVQNAVTDTNQNSTTNWFVPLTDTPEDGPPIVLPGTKQVDVEVSWEGPAPHLDEVGLCYRTAAGGAHRCLAPQASPAAWSIQAAPHDADNGHQLFSFWTFELYHPSLEEDPEPSVGYGDVDVKITLTKGNVPVDDPHPRFWEDSASLVVLDTTYTRSSLCCSFEALAPEHVVPPGTTRVRIEHAWEENEAIAQAGWTYPLIVRTAGMNPHTTDRDRDAWMEPEPVEGSLAERSVAYEWELEEGDTDAFYQNFSLWRIAWYNDLHRDLPNARVQPVTHEVRMTVFNDDL